MKIIRKPVIENYKVFERAVEQQFNLKENSINLLDLFAEECDNPCYQSIYFDENALKSAQELLERVKKHNYPDVSYFYYQLLVKIYLHNILPNDNEVLWWCEW